MVYNYLKIAWRNIAKHKIFSLINIGGLAIGIAAVIMIFLYIQTELSYDNFHEHQSNIYRVGFSAAGEQSGQASAAFTAPFSIDAQKLFPEIASSCRVSENHESWFSYGDKRIKTATLKYADASLFQFFSFTLLSGNVMGALKDPYTIVLSKNIAEKLFGNTDAVGKMITVDGSKNYMVTAVSENVPDHSTIQFEAVASITTLYQDNAYHMDWNGGWQYQHYLLLQPHTQIAGLEAKFKNFMWHNFNEKFAGTNSKQWLVASLQPLAKIHLWYSDDAVNTRTNIYVFSLIALLVLLISCINYINLSIAGASSRFKEIGVRKVLGAFQKQLIKQFMSETGLVTLLALLLAGIITVALFPIYQNILGRAITLDASQLTVICIFGCLLLVLINLVAGGYLSFYLSALKPVNIFKMQLPASGKQRLSNILIVLQFAISVALIAAVFMVQLQMRYVKSRPSGFDKEHIIVLTLTGKEVQQKSELLKQQIEKLAGVTSVSAMSEVPYNDITRNGFLPEGRKDYLTIHQLDADPDLLRTLNIGLKSGQYFSSDHPSGKEGYIINQALADELGWQDPIGKSISRDGVHKVIGVVQDFHFASLHDKIGPLIITNKPYMDLYGFLVVKYGNTDPVPLMEQLHAIWKDNVSAPFDYWFLDTAFNTLYQSEQRFQQLFLYFSLLSVILSLAGVFGMVLLTIQQKTKEIGIRKVLGAGVTDILALTAKKYVYLILVAFAIAVPAAWMYINNWLQSFAYRITVQWWMFVLPALVVLVFAFLVMAIQTMQALMANPVKSLRRE